MRSWELLVEDSESQFDSDLEDLLIAAKANGITEVDVDSLVDQLNSMGYAVSPDSLVNALEGHEHAHEFIKTITIDKILLKTHVLDDEVAGNGDYEDIEVDAERLASSTAMKGVKQSQNKQRKIAKDAID